MAHGKGHLIINSLNFTVSKTAQVIFRQCVICWCISDDETCLVMIMIFECILNISRNVNEVEPHCTIWSCWTHVLVITRTPLKNYKRKNHNSPVTLNLKLNANLAALSKLPHSSALILTDPCRKWKAGDFLFLFVWTEEEERKKTSMEAWPFSLEVSQNALLLANASACAQSHSKGNKGTVVCPGRRGRVWARCPFCALGGCPESRKGD